MGFEYESAMKYTTPIVNAFIARAKEERDRAAREQELEQLRQQRREEMEFSRQSAFDLERLRNEDATKRDDVTYARNLERDEKTYARQRELAKEHLDNTLKAQEAQWDKQRKDSEADYKRRTNTATLSQLQVEAINLGFDPGNMSAEELRPLVVEKKKEQWANKEKGVLSLIEENRDNYKRIGKTIEGRKNAAEEARKEAFAEADKQAFWEAVVGSKLPEKTKEGVRLWVDGKDDNGDEKNKILAISPTTKNFATSDEAKRVMQDYADRKKNIMEDLVKSNRLLERERTIQERYDGQLLSLRNKIALNDHEIVAFKSNGEYPKSPEFWKANKQFSDEQFERAASESNPNSVLNFTKEKQVQNPNLKQPEGEKEKNKSTIFEPSIMAIPRMVNGLTESASDFINNPFNLNKNYQSIQSNESELEKFRAQKINNLPFSVTDEGIPDSMKSWTPTGPAAFGESNNKSDDTLNLNAVLDDQTKRQLEQLGHGPLVSKNLFNSTVDKITKLYQDHGIDEQKRARIEKWFNYAKIQGNYKNVDPYQLIPKAADGDTSALEEFETILNDYHKTVQNP